MNNGQPAKRYHQIKNRLFFINLLQNILALLFLGLSGLSVYLKDQILLLSQQFLIVNALYAVCFSVFFSILGFPISFYEGFILEHQFNLSNQSFLNWCKEGLKNFALGLVVILVGIEGLYLFLKKFPLTWWLWATAFWLFLTIVIARITPIFIIPLFFKYRKLEKVNLKTKIFMLFDKCQLKIKEVFYIDFSTKTKKANAFICGLGRNRRLVLSDTLLEKFNDPEIAEVVAHELGHYKHHDIAKLILANSAVSFLSFFLISRILQVALLYFGFSRMDDIAFLPFLALGIFLLGLVALPLTNAFSRHLEKGADRFCLTLTQDPENFITMMRKLGELNLADFSPHPLIEILLYDHPAIAKRIKFAEETIHDYQGS